MRFNYKSQLYGPHGKNTREALASFLVNIIINGQPSLSAPMGSELSSLLEGPSLFLFVTHPLPLPRSASTYASLHKPAVRLAAISVVVVIRLMTLRNTCGIAGNPQRRPLPRTRASGS
jgi:hypothetical protein